ncbi:MAG: hypothetical protein QXZ44_03315 [Ferroplasma sp.]
MFKNISIENKSIARIIKITALFVLLSIALYIAASLIGSIYTLSIHYNMLFKIGIVFVIIVDILYAAIILLYRNLENANIDDKFIFLTIILFFAIFISEIIIEIASGISIFPAIIGIVGLFFAVLYYYLKDDDVLSRIMIIISAIMAYLALASYPLKAFAYIFGTSYFNSALWAQAFIIFEIFLLLSFIFKDSSIISDLLSSGGKALAIFIFGIGMLITGGELIAPSFPGFPAAIGGSMDALLTISGIFAIISGIFIIVLSAIDFYLEVIKPRIRFIR